MVKGFKPSRLAATPTGNNGSASLLMVCIV
jgi:hypothetical protein